MMEDHLSWSLKSFIILGPEVSEELTQGSHRFEKYLKIKSALKSTGKSLKSLEKSSNSTIFCSTQHFW